MWNKITLTALLFPLYLGISMPSVSAHVNPTNLPYANCGEVPAIKGTARLESPVAETFGTGYAYAAKLVNHPNLTYVVHTTGRGSSTLRNYTMLYDKSKRAALWVAYTMQNNRYPNHHVGRKSAWHYDPAIPRADQPNLHRSYLAAGASYDRGHQIASNSRQVSISQNKETYYFTNMTPQVASLNRGKWARLERKEQGWDNLASTDTLFVVTGPVFSSYPRTTKDMSGHRCALPSGFFKVIVKASFVTPGNCNNVQGVAFYFPTNGWHSWNVSNTSIDAIERMTGFDFFANLPLKYTTKAEKTSSYSFLK